MAKWTVWRASRLKLRKRLVTWSLTRRQTAWSALWTRKKPSRVELFLQPLSLDRWVSKHMNLVQRLRQKAFEANRRLQITNKWKDSFRSTMIYSSRKASFATNSTRSATIWFKSSQASYSHKTKITSLKSSSGLLSSKELQVNSQSMIWRTCSKK